MLVITDQDGQVNYRKGGKDHYLKTKMFVS